MGLLDTRLSLRCSCAGSFLKSIVSAAEVFQREIGSEHDARKTSYKLPIVTHAHRGVPIANADSKRLTSVSSPKGYQIVNSLGGCKPKNLSRPDFGPLLQVALPVSRHESENRCFVQILERNRFQELREDFGKCHVICISIVVFSGR